MNKNINLDNLSCLERNIKYLEDYQWIYQWHCDSDNYVNCNVCGAKFALNASAKRKHKEDCQLMIDLEQLKKSHKLEQKNE